MLPEILNRVNDERPQNAESRWRGSADICTNWLLKTIQYTPDRDVALIIGAGRTDDFQLNKIVKEFNTTFLLDIDEKSIHIAFNKLSPSEKAKVELITCDVTGMVEESNQLIQTLRKNNITQSEIFKAIESYRNKLPYQFKPVAKIPTCSWIFSNCITTQLFSPLVFLPLLDITLGQLFINTIST